MSDFLSKYNGEEIDERLERVDYLIPKSAITQSFETNLEDHVPSSAMSHELKRLVDILYERFVNNDMAQSIEGEKNFLAPALFSSGLTVPSGQEVTIATDPVGGRGAVAKEYMDKRAVDTNVAGKGLRFVAGSPNSIEVELDFIPGLKLTTNDANAKLRVDITGTPEAGTAAQEDELLFHSVTDGLLRKIKKSAFLGGLTKSLRIRGTWDPSTNAVAGDALNATLAKAVAPVTPTGDSPDGSQYVVSADGSADIVGDGTTELFRQGDSVVWSGSAWLLLRDQSKVVSFAGAQGSYRQGMVVAAYGDYRSSMVTYDRLNANKKDIQASTVDTETAISDLDDKKLPRLNPVILGSATFQDGSTGALSYNFSDATTGAYALAGEVVHQVSGQEVFSVKSTGLFTKAGKYISLNSLGYLTDYLDGATRHVLLSATNEARVRGSTVRIRGTNDVDIIAADPTLVAIRPGGVDVLRVTPTAISAKKQLVLEQGTAALPILNFNGYPADGMFNIGTGIGFSVTGVEKVRIQSTSVLMAVPVAMGTSAGTAKQINWLADPVADNDAVNLKTLNAKVASLYAANVFLTNITTSTAITSIDKTVYQGGKFIISCVATAGGPRQVVEVLLAHDGAAEVYVTEYGQVGPDLMTLSYSVSGNNVILNVLPNTGSCSFSLKTVALL